MAGWEVGTALVAAATCTLGWCLAWCVRRMRRRRLLYNSSAIEVIHLKVLLCDLLLGWMIEAQCKVLLVFILVRD